jgi:hypothetical protein
MGGVASRFREIVMVMIFGCVLAACSSNHVAESPTPTNVGCPSGSAPDGAPRVLKVSALAKSDVSLAEVNSYLVQNLLRQQFSNCLTDTGTLKRGAQVTLFVYFRPAWASPREVEAVAEALKQSGLFKSVNKR